MKKARAKSMRKKKKENCNIQKRGKVTDPWKD